MFNESIAKDIRALAHEKSIDIERVFSALEDALSTAAKKYYRTREPIEAVLDRASGKVEIHVVKQVVASEDEIEDPLEQLSIEEAQKLDPSAEVGGTIRLNYVSKVVVDTVSDPNTEIRWYEAKKRTLDSALDAGRD